MKSAVRLLFALALLALAAAPASAQTRVDSLPAITPTNSGRFDFALTLFGEIIAYGKGEFESASRVHLAVKTVPMGDTPEQTVEAILYDGVYYTRENDSAQWYIEGEVPAPLPEDQLPDDEFGDAPITLIGEVELAGAPTYQYQVWLNGEDGSVGTVDFFVGRDPSYLHKLVISAYSTAADTIPVLGFDYRYYDFNAPVTVYAPQGAAARPASAPMSLAGLLKASVFQARAVQIWAR